jgi:hypothetical protein
LSDIPTTASSTVNAKPTSIDGTRPVVFTAIEPRIAPNTVGTHIFLIGTGFTENVDSLVLTVNGKSISSDNYQVAEFNGQFYVKWILGKIIAVDYSGIVVVALGRNGQNEQHQTQQLQFFSTQSSQIGPDMLFYPFVQTTVQISGLPGMTQGSPYCVFYVQNRITDVPKVISFNPAQLNDEIYQCSLSPDSYAGKSAKIFVNILLDKPRFATPDYPNVDNLLRKEYFADASNLANFITLIAPAPIITGAQFSDNGASVVVTFDRAVQIINADTYMESDYLTPFKGSISCRNVFDSNLSGKYEETIGDCTISLNTIGSIDINLSGKFSNKDINALAVNDWVGLLNNTIAAAGEAFSRTASGSSQVSPPPNIPIPRLQVLFSTIVTECSDVLWDFSQSSSCMYSLIILTFL